MKSNIDPSRIYVQVFEEGENKSELHLSYMLDGEAYAGYVEYRDGSQECSFTKLEEDAEFTQQALAIDRSEILRKEVNQRIERHILSRDILLAC